jgi:hypothetical protein
MLRRFVALPVAGDDVFAWGDAFDGAMAHRNTPGAGDQSPSG